MAVLGGVRPALAALPVLLALVAGITVFAVGSDTDRGVPEAVLASQQHIAEDGAVALRAAVDESVSDLRGAAADFATHESGPPDRLLTSLDRNYRKWRGTAVVDLSSGRLLAARGEDVPLGKVDLRGLPANPPPRLLKDDSGSARLLIFATLTQGGRQELLVASQSLKVPSITTGKDHTLHVVDRAGTTVTSAGPGAGTDQAKALAGAAVREAAGKGPSETAAAGGFDGPSGSLIGYPEGSTRAAAGYARVSAGLDAKASPSSALGLTVVTTVRTERDSAGTGDLRLALLAAGLLLILAAGVTGTLWALLERPLLRLRREANRLEEGDLATPVRIPRFGEPARVGTALEALRLQLLGERRQSSENGRKGRITGRRRLGLRTVLVTSSIVLLAWSAPMMLTLGRKWPDTAAAVPRLLSSDQRQRTETAAERVRRGINEGYADLAHLATVTDDARPEAIREILGNSMKQHARYRALYLVNDSGKILVRAGGDPRTPRKARVTPGVVQANTSGREPVIAAVAAQPAAATPHRTERRCLVGEFKVQYLVGILTRPGLGSVWLVDSAHRVIASSKGFVAFGPISDDRLRNRVDAAHDSRGSTGLVLGRRSPAIAAMVPLKETRGAASALGWQVASIRPTFWIGLPEYEAQRRIMLVGLLGLTTGAFCLGWLYVVVVRPLRDVAQRAEALADGDRRTVLYPRYHDEVGSLARGLELIRQRLLPSGAPSTSSTVNGRPASVPLPGTGSDPRS
jgi:HAMP domain-containing protein